MITDISQEVYIFLCCAITGIVSALIYDFFRAVRRNFPNNKVKIISDIFYWIIITVILSYICYTTNDGLIRWYMFLALVLGYVLYCLFPSKYILKLLIGAIRFCKSLFKKTCTIIVFPIKRLIKLLILIFRPLKKLFAFLKRKLCGINIKININFLKFKRK